MYEQRNKDAKLQLVTKFRIRYVPANISTQVFLNKDIERVKYYFSYQAMDR